MGKKSIHQELEEAVREKEEPAEAADKQSGKARKERRDKGKKLIKQRDLVVLLWIAQQYAARLDHVQKLLSRMPGRGGKQVSPTGLTLSAVLQVVDRWVALGLVQYRRIYEGEPGWIWVTPYGLGLLQLAYARHTPGVSTWSAVTQTSGGSASALCGLASPGARRAACCLTCRMPRCVRRNG